MAACSASYSKKSCNLASESASYSGMKGKMAAESASYGILKGRTAAESAPGSEIQQTARKINGFSCQKEAAQRLVGVRPGGRRVGRMLRFAEADTDSASAFGFVLLTLP